MSLTANYKLWVATKKDIDRLIQRQNILKKMEPLEQGPLTYKLFSELYVLYADLANKLATIYLKTFQVQKRKVVRQLVEAANRRLLELKNELKNAELNEYIYTDKALIARKLTPYDLVIWRSPAFLYRRPPEIQSIIYKNEPFLDPEKAAKCSQKKAEELRDAVILIQAHERARQARIYKANIKYDIKNLKQLPRAKASYKFNHNTDQPMSIPVKRTIFNPNYVKKTESCAYLEQVEIIKETVSEDRLGPKYVEAAKVIQNAWRAYKRRKDLKKKIVLKETVLGVFKKKRPLRPNDFHDDIVQTYKDEILRHQLDEEFLKFVTDERVRILQQRSPWIMEDISDHIRGWFREFYDKLGQFHPYPEPLKSGTVLVVIDESFTVDELKDRTDKQNLSKEEKKKLAEKEKQQKEKEREKIKKQKMQEAKRRKKMKAAGIIDLGYEFSNNKNIMIMEKTIKEYSIDWKIIDEYLNKNNIIKDWVTESELAIIHKELRALVDEFMRIEYEILQQALATDLKKKYKPPKIKKEKKKKEKKRKKVKDLTEDRTIESLYDEFEKAGIIEKLQHKSFDEFIGEFNFIADDTRDDDGLTTLEATKGDIKMVIHECMIGMGEFDVDKPKAVCLIGPTRSGKELLCKIIASELDAVFMNISPEKTAQYADNMPYFINNLLKVARAFQPTIFYIENVNRVFWKKVPPDQDDLNPRLLESVLAKKILKPLKKQEKVMLLGTSDAPWTAKPKMKRIFQKIILIPQSDYGSSFLIWLEFITRLAGDHKLQDCDISTLARTLKKYTSGDITEDIENTLNLDRRMNFNKQPINPEEFIDYFLARDEPVFAPEDKVFAKFTKYFNASNKMSKLRRAFLKKKEARKKKK